MVDKLGRSIYEIHLGEWQDTQPAFVLCAVL
jgi:hypothetical protein